MYSKCGCLKSESNFILLSQGSCGVNSSMKRMRESSLPKVDAALFRWFKDIQSENMMGITGQDLQKKAADLAKQLGLGDVEITMSWINRWKQRHNVISKKIIGESGSVDDGVVKDWLTKHLPLISAEFDPSNIFNADETGVFWCAMPKQTLAFKGQQCKGGKQSKARLTVLVAASMAGEKLPLFVIGRSAKPRCFRGWKNLPTAYTGQRKAWMTSEIFESWVRDLDKRMTAQGRKIALLVDNCPGHPNVTGLNAVKLFFLPPKTTAVLQPMDAGIIWSLKCHFRKIVVERRIAAFDKGEDYKLSLIDGLIFLRSAWERVTKETVTNCFKKAFSVSDSESKEFEASSAIEDDVEDLWKRLPESDSTCDNLQFRDYVNIDQSVITAEVPTETDIIRDLQNDSEDNDGNESDDAVTELIDVEVTPPTTAAANQALITLERYLTSRGAEAPVLSALNGVQLFIAQQVAEKQSKITDFFS